MCKGPYAMHAACARLVRGRKQNRLNNTHGYPRRALSKAGSALAGEVLVCARVHHDLLPDVDEHGHVDNGASLQRGRLGPTCGQRSKQAARLQPDVVSRTGNGVTLVASASVDDLRRKKPAQVSTCASRGRTRMRAFKITELGTSTSMICARSPA